MVFKESLNPGRASPRGPSPLPQLDLDEDFFLIAVSFSRSRTFASTLEFCMCMCGWCFMSDSHKLYNIQFRSMRFVSALAHKDKKCYIAVTLFMIVNSRLTFIQLWIFSDCTTTGTVERGKMVPQSNKQLTIADLISEWQIAIGIVQRQNNADISPLFRYANSDIISLVRVQIILSKNLFG